jgi:HPt (histidine-containing phosphotransfer) domain-containing protein
VNIAREQADLVDFSQIDALLDAAGRDGVNDIMLAFWRSTEKLTRQLRTEIDNDKLIDAARTAHAIKGSAANVGASRLSSSARSVETGCKMSDAVAAIAALDDLLRVYEDTQRVLTAHINAAA